MTTIMCIGIAVADFVFRVDEMPRKAEKYRAKDATIVGGGCAANAAVAISRLGGNALLGARLGKDVVSDIILHDLERDGVDCSLVQHFEQCRSSYSSIFIDDNGERQIVNYRDARLPDDTDWIAKGAPLDIAIMLTDTRWPGGAIATARLAHDRGIPCVLDVEEPAREAAEAIRFASHPAFSAQGLRDFTGEEDLDRALAMVEREAGGWAAVTDGSGGVTVRENGKVRKYVAPPVDVVDTLGAGDVWHGALALVLAEGKDEPEAIGFANHAASLKCTRFGGRDGTPTRIEVETFMKARQ